MSIIFTYMLKILLKLIVTKIAMNIERYKFINFKGSWNFELSVSN